MLTQETRKELPVMSSETRERLEEKGFPDAILEVIGSDAEAQIYDDANLEPAQVNGKDALIRTDIDYDQKDEFGKTNLERMKLGKPPLDADGNPIELHHIGQKSDAPLAELTRGEHRGNGNDNVLHDKLKESVPKQSKISVERKIEHEPTQGTGGASPGRYASSDHLKHRGPGRDTGICAVA